MSYEAPHIYSSWTTCSHYFGRDEFTSPGFGRFLIRPDGLVIPNGSEGVAGVAAISGVPYSELYPAIYASDPKSAFATLARRTVDEVAIIVQAEIALAPLPPLPTREPTEAPASTEIPSPVETAFPSSGSNETPTPHPSATP